MTPTEIARTLVWFASDLERRGVDAGILRVAARSLVALAVDTPNTSRPDGCRGCGEPIVQKRTGRPRQWCSERCRRKPAGK